MEGCGTSNFSYGRLSQTMEKQVKTIFYFLYSFVPVIFKCNCEDNGLRKLRKRITVYNVLIYYSTQLFLVVGR